MYCDKCGIELKDDTRFCYNCGAKVNQSNDTDNNLTVVGTEQTNKNSAKKKSTEKPDVSRETGKQSSAQRINSKVKQTIGLDDVNDINKPEKSTQNKTWEQKLKNIWTALIIMVVAYGSIFLLALFGASLVYGISNFEVFFLMAVPTVLYIFGLVVLKKSRDCFNRSDTEGGLRFLKRAGGLLIICATYTLISGFFDVMNLVFAIATIVLTAMLFKQKKWIETE